MHLASGRVFTIAIISCLVTLLFISLSPVGQTQDKNPQKAASPLPAQAPSPSPTPAVDRIIDAVPVAPVDPNSPAPTGQKTDFGQGPVITNTDLITVTVTVTDTYGRYVSGLGKGAFTILDEKKPQEITYFSDDDSPVSVGVIFDVSGSMGGDKIKRARDALSKFVQTSHNMDEYFLIAFNSRAQLLLDKTRDGNQVLDKLTFVQTKNNTALYDACYLGVEKVQRGAHPKRALLLISDGQDNNSRYTFGELRRLLKESDVTLYGIGILSGSDAGSSMGMEGQGILDELASVSGGKAFFPRSNAEMDDIFEQIALELRHQYSIGYKPVDFANDGRWHKIKVRVTPPRGLPRLFVRSKEGYYAVPSSR
ncbi:MAG TPA: VWA domain-containing protein [Pyrinomonadaceae bacterium]|jgi:Ca-activated chloride channel family protein|nr:VWA domain-containing protein [Pyrinomonadaceae bacterium]